MPDPFRSTARRHLDAEFEQAREHLPEPPPDGWIATVRQALGMSRADLARRMGVTRAAVGRMEKSERAGTIQLSTLQRAASALGGAVRYAVIPEVPLEEMVQQRAADLARRELAAVNHAMALEAQRPDVHLDDELVRARAAELVASPTLWADTS